MDQEFKKRVNQFLACKHIAITGYSRGGKAVGNHLYEKFNKNGYNTVVVNPHAAEITEVDAYKDILSLPNEIEAVMISSPPDQTLGIIEQCAQQGIKHVWIHKSIGNGSYDAEAIEYANKNGIQIIPKACPMMFIEADGFHKFMKWVMDFTGSLKV